MFVFVSHKQQSHAINPKVWWFYQQPQTEAHKPLGLTDERKVQDGVAVV
jgi:hypothetical protein